MPVFDVQTFRKRPERARSHPKYGCYDYSLLSCIVNRVNSFTFAGCIPTNRVFHSRVRRFSFSPACRMIFRYASKSCVSTPLCIVNANGTSFYFCSCRVPFTSGQNIIHAPADHPNPNSRTHVRNEFGVGRKISSRVYLFMLGKDSVARMLS